MREAMALRSRGRAASKTRARYERGHIYLLYIY
jgi:hypothetical protein